MNYCKNCGKPLDGKRASASYCGNGCKSRAHRKRKGLPEPAFLTAGGSGSQRLNRGWLSPEEERSVRILEIEIASYNEHLKSAEEKYTKLHKIKVEYELTGTFLEEKKIKGGEVRLVPHEWSYDPAPRLKWDGRVPGTNNPRYPEYQLAQQDYKKASLEHRKDPSAHNRVQEAEKLVYGPFLEAERQLQAVAQEVISRKNQIAAILNGAAQRKQKNKALTGADLLKMEFQTLPFTEKWKELIGTPSAVFYGLCWGDAKAGKSYLSIEFAQYLTRFGRVLYIAVEEGISHTLKEKVQNTKAIDIELFASRDIHEIEQSIKPYHSFVFLDSATVLDIPPAKIEELRKAHPDSSFVILLQSTKEGGNFRGGQAWKHNVDFILEVIRSGEKQTRVVCTGRFGNGALEYAYSL